MSTNALTEMLRQRTIKVQINCGRVAFIEKNDYSFPIFYDTQSDAAMTYGAYSLPTTYFIDAEGYAIAQATGAIDAETLQRGIDMILPQK